MGKDDWPDSDAWEIGFHQEPEDECEELVDEEYESECETSDGEMDPPPVDWPQ